MGRPRKLVQVMNTIAEEAPIPVSTHDVSEIRSKVQAKAPKKVKKAVNQTMVAIKFTPKAELALTKAAEESRQSRGTIINFAIEFAAQNNAFASLDKKVPKSVLKARALLAEWEAPARLKRARAK